MIECNNSIDIMIELHQKPILLVNKQSDTHQNQHNSCRPLKNSQTQSIKKNIKLKYQVIPIESQSQTQNQINKAYDGTKHQAIDNSQAAFYKQTTTISKRNKYIKKARKTKFNPKTVKIENIQLHEANLDFLIRKNLPQECYALNLLYKQQFVRQLRQLLQKMIDRRLRGQGLLIVGDNQIGKKTILFQNLEMLSSKERSIKSYYFDFRDAQDENKKKWMRLIDLAKLINESYQKSKQIQENNGQCQIDQDAIKMTQYHFIVINHGNDFMRQIKRKAKLKLKQLINKLSLSFIFISSDLNSDKFGLICDHYQIIKCPHNEVKFYAETLYTAINQYNFLTHKWAISKAVANYISKQLSAKACLKLSLIANLIDFLEYKAEKRCSLEKEANIINGELLEQFLRVVLGKQMKINIANLNIHERCGLIACYTYLNQTQQLLIDSFKLYWTYVWVCKSLSINAKQMKQFSRQTLEQLLTYNFLRVYRSKGTIKQKELFLCLLDLDEIKNAYQNDLLMSKFFTDKSWLQNVG